MQPFSHFSMFWAVAACAFLGNASAALAETAPSKLGDCHAIESGAERLACYDRLSGRAAAPAAIAAPATPAGARAPTQTARVEAPAAAVKPPSYLQEAWGLTADSPRFGVSYYHTNYLLFARYSDNPNNNPYKPIYAAAGKPDYTLNDTEAKFQISAKVRVWSTEDRRWSVYGAYTQQSMWDVYSSEISRPFRETNYMPEGFVTYAPDLSLWGFDWRVLSGGFTHQSNGRSDLLSRSWNRLFLEAGVERGNLAVTARAWYRLPEDASEDDNPNITDYYGHGEITALYRWRENSFRGAVRGNVSEGKGALQLGWYSRPLIGPLRGYVQFFTGYGESLIDYNWQQTTIGAGIALSDGP